MTYEFLQHYWCFIVALLGALLVFLLFVQGANSAVRTICDTEEDRRLVYNSTGRKWEFTFTTLVTFGGAFFASFPLFYSTSFGGAYWLWMILLFTFVLQAVSYEFQSKTKHPAIFRFFLTINGYFGPLLLGCAVATFFEGANFIIEENNMMDVSATTPVISRWENASHGLDCLLNPWVFIFGIAVYFLARTLGLLYIINNVADKEIRSHSYPRLIGAAIHFVVLFTIFMVHLLLKKGYSYNDDGVIYMESYKYLTNFVEMWYLLILLVVGVVLVVYGILRTLINKTYFSGIWPAGIGTVLTVLALLLCAMWNHTAYYPSLADLQSSLTMANSCSSEFTLRTMFYASLFVPFVLAYIFYCWRAIDKKKLDKEEIKTDHAY